MGNGPPPLRGIYPYRVKGPPPYGGWTVPTMQVHPPPTPPLEKGLYIYMAISRGGVGGGKNRWAKSYIWPRGGDTVPAFGYASAGARGSYIYLSLRP